MSIGSEVPQGPVSVTGHTARWERHNSERQQRILEAAVELIEESPSGEHITVLRIAKRAGLAKSVVYRQFNGREDLDRRIRSHLVDGFSDALDTELDIAHGSLEEILTRTVQTVAVWVTDHPQLHEFLGTGSTHYDEVTLDAISSLKGRIAQRAQEIIGAIATLLDADDSPFASLPFAVVTMVEGTLTNWARDPAPDRTREQIVTDLATYAWYVLDGAARTAGIVVDPKTELVTVIKQLTGPRRDVPV